MDMKSFSLAKHDPELAKRIQVKESKKLASWAILCIRRVLPIFEQKYPEIDIPKKAINLLKSWIQDEISMWESRTYCFEILEYAREIEDLDKVSALIMRGVSHMLATCHVKMHAEKAAMYVIAALKEIHKNDEDVTAILEQERSWQIHQLDNC